uniref:Uncharacterized protein n=1 Tax=Alexandrium monilatum TaxID=311494 RepID=A0A7S4VMV5_9DINO
MAAARQAASAGAGTAAEGTVVEPVGFAARGKDCPSVAAAEVATTEVADTEAEAAASCENVGGGASAEADTAIVCEAADAEAEGAASCGNVGEAASAEADTAIDCEASVPDLPVAGVPCRGEAMETIATGKRAMETIAGVTPAQEVRAGAEAAPTAGPPPAPSASSSGGAAAGRSRACGDGGVWAYVLVGEGSKQRIFAVLRGPAPSTPPPAGPAGAANPQTGTLLMQRPTPTTRDTLRSAACMTRTCPVPNAPQVLQCWNRCRAGGRGGAASRGLHVPALAAQRA